VEVVDLWTGRHASALRAALRLTNEGFARTVGTAVRTVAKWNAQSDVVLVPALQRALDQVLSQAPADAKIRFAALVATTESPTDVVPTVQSGRPSVERVDNDSTLDVATRRLDSDANLRDVLDWIDKHADWPPGYARHEVKTHLGTLNMAALTQRRGQVSRSAIADALATFYGIGRASHHGLYRARCGGVPVTTTILTSTDWLDLRLTLGRGRDRLSLDAAASTPVEHLDHAAALAAARRLAEALSTGSQIIDTPLYRLHDIDIGSGHLAGTVGLGHFTSYAMTMDLLEAEIIDALSGGRPSVPGTLPLRDRYLPTVDAVTGTRRRLCAGGALALFAAARPGTRHRPGEPDYVLLVQERSGQVLNAAGRLAVIPKSFHEPLVDYRDDAQLSATLERELEEELFGRADVDSTQGGRRHADPFHLSRLSAPMRWLIERADSRSWHMECTGFGFNLVSGNYEFACLIIVDDEQWWKTFAGSIEANWETGGLRRYSSLDGNLLASLIQDPAWSNEGLFALMQGLRRLAEHDPQRVNLPPIELEM
jgi:hypothetical protein